MGLAGSLTTRGYAGAFINVYHASQHTRTKPDEECVLLRCGRDCHGSGPTCVWHCHVAIILESGRFLPSARARLGPVLRFGGLPSTGYTGPNPSCAIGYRPSCGSRSRIPIGWYSTTPFRHAPNQVPPLLLGQIQSKLKANISLGFVA